MSTIRVHSQNIIILGTRNWCQELDEATANPVEGDNVAYCLHFYASTHGAFRRGNAQKALDRGHTVFVSEWGTCESSGNGALNLNEVNAWHDWMDQNAISSANWAVSDKQESCSALLPGASTDGNWGGEERLTESGRWVRRKIQSATGTPTHPTSPPPTLAPPAPTPHPTPRRHLEPTLAPTTPTPTTRPTPYPTSPSTPPPPTFAPPTPTSPTQIPEAKPTPTPTSGPSTQSCNELWARCGGIGWTGATCCKWDNICRRKNPSYSQCVRSRDTPTQSCTKLWAQCGGTNWKGATCCSEDSVCKLSSSWYSQCVPPERRAAIKLSQSTAEDLPSAHARRSLKVHRPYSGEQVLLQNDKFLDHGKIEL